MIESTNTIRLHRILKTAPAKVYRAFVESTAVSKWLPPHGFTCTIHHFEPLIGGKFRISFTNFTNGRSQTFGGRFLELIPDVKLRYAESFEDQSMPGEMIVTVVLQACPAGTELEIEQSGISAAIPPAMCYLGWQESLDQLACLVEPDISEG